MRSQLILTAATLAAFLTASAAFADTYRNKQSGDWDDVNTWEVDTNDNGTYDQSPAAAKPDDTDYVIIHDAGGGANEVDVDTAEAGDHINVESDGLLDIEAGGTLTLDGSDSATHTVAGEIRLSASDSILAFTSNSQTLNGAGKIEGRHNTSKITIADTYNVTSNIDVVGSLQIRGLDASEPPDAGFVNDDVVEATRANDNDNTLVLYSGRFSGSGPYKVNFADATLQVGSVETIDASGMVFSVGAGTLYFEATVTTANLTFSGGAIQVGSGVTFTVNP